MRIVFAGTPEFAATALAAIVDAGMQVCLVLTQPDRPAGRGMKAAPGPVRRLGLERGLEVAAPRSLSLIKGGEAAAAAHAQLRAARPDVLVVAAYGLILPQAVLDIPAGLPDAGCGRLTALNIHGSLLPRWRGAAPVARAIEAGDAATGITIMQMDAGLDTGPMLMAESTPILAQDSAATLTGRLAAIGARLIVDALREGAAGRLRALPQSADGATYAPKLDKQEAWLDFTLGAEVLARRVRAFDPFPGACASRGATTLKLWRALARPGRPEALPGTVLAAGAAGVQIACGSGALLVSELQRPGSRRMSAAEFLAGTPIAVGEVLAGRPPQPAA
ncbi:MAG: methionyl-tRNA formyltransferase [Burkholderiaceae bacterium]|jgi:methionyl-tRNA formyltransferase|nr:methionyl-tRNA formyltransferase [Burkholderiaceae bacterium]